MSFFFTEDEKIKKRDKNLRIAAELGCSVCPRNSLTWLKHPKMKPTGSNKPIIYVLGESPGKNEDFKGEQFIGDSGEILRDSILSVLEGDVDYKEFTRFSNVVRCFHKNEKPTQFEVECCLDSTIKDIESHKPIALFSFGETPLKAIIGGKSVGMWRGRRVPIKVGRHVCWFFPFYHPAFILRNKVNKYKNEYERNFEDDMRNAVDFLFGGKEDFYHPTVIEDGYKDGITIVKSGLSDFLSSYDEPIYAIDIETTALKPNEPKASIISIAVGTEQKVYAFPYSYEIKDGLKSLLEKSHAKIAHNLKFELEWFIHLFDGDQKFIRNSIWHDTMAQAYIIDERTSREEGMLSLDRLTQLYYGFNLKEKSNVDRKQLVLSDETLLYNGMDSKYEYKLFFDQQKKIQKEQNLELCYNNLIKTAATLSITETKGLNIDLVTMKKLTNKYHKRMERIMKVVSGIKEIKQFETTSNFKFNPLSNDDVVYVFKEIYKYPQLKETSGGKSGNKKYAVDNEVLQRFQNEQGSKLAKYILMYRVNKKLFSTYVENVEGNMVNGKLYPNFNIYFTSTGRLSSGREQ
jgi:uracil-DNA glycosylase